MFFTSERELQKKLTILDLGIRGKYRTTLLRREVPVGGCIPDVVYVRFSEFPNAELWPRRWNFTHTYIVWLLRRWSRLRPETVSSRTYETPEKTARILHDLIKSGAVVKLNSGSLMLSEEMLAVSAEVIAVEAKLCKWREAISQAKVYKRFANRVFVAMDADKVPRQPDILKQFQELGVGLSAVSSNSMKWLVYPPQKRFLGAEREYLIASSVAPTSQALWSRRKL